MKIDDSEMPRSAAKPQKASWAAPTLSLLMRKLMKKTSASGGKHDHPAGKIPP